MFRQNTLPLLLDAQEAVEHYRQRCADMTDAERAYVVAFLSREGYTNRQIRESLGIAKVYTVTHLKRAGMLSEDELLLWKGNPERITLGHVRAVAALPRPRREEFLRGLLHTRVSVHRLEAIAQGRDAEGSPDIRRFETRMSDATGRPIKLRYDQASRTGSLTLGFASLDDLDDVCRALGFEPSEQS